MTGPSQEAYAKFLQYVHERGQYRDAEYPQISTRLQGHTASDLKDRKAKWHRKCYGSTCHCGYLERARVRHQKACEQGENQHLQQRRGRPSASASVSDSSAQSNTPRFTRSSTTPFNARLCFFFCQEDRKDAVHEVCTFSMGEKLQKAVEASNNQTWKVQLSSAISGDDAHAVDVKYHLPCWVKNVQRGATREGEGACSERN